MSRYLTRHASHRLAQQLSVRDWQVLRYVSALRFASGAQLARLCFVDGGQPDTRAARRSLLRLVQLGILDRLPRAIGGVRAGSAGFVYRLGLGGHRLAAFKGWLPEHWRRRSQVPGLLFVRHTLAIAELHTRLIECERSGRVELLALDAEPLCHRYCNGLDGQRVILKPDSYARLGLGPYEDSYFIEVDRATRGSRALTDQLQRYVAYYRTGREQAARGVFPKTLWLTTDAERVRVIADCIASLPTDAQTLFQVTQFDQALAVMTDPKE
jgi:Replication-relaxation